MCTRSSQRLILENTAAVARTEGIDLPGSLGHHTEAVVDQALAQVCVVYHVHKGGARLQGNEEERERGSRSEVLAGNSELQLWSRLNLNQRTNERYRDQCNRLQCLLYML